MTDSLSGPRLSTTIYEKDGDMKHAQNVLSHWLRQKIQTYAQMTTASSNHLYHGDNILMSFYKAFKPKKHAC